MPDRLYNVLFLCTGNSARSIIAEALMNQWGRGKFRGFSAGSHPKGAVHPIALALLQRMNFPTEGLRSKGWEEFVSLRRGRPRLISCSPSVTTPQQRPVPTGPVSP